MHAFTETVQLVSCRNYEPSSHHPSPLAVSSDITIITVIHDSINFHQSYQCKHPQKWPPLSTMSPTSSTRVNMIFEPPQIWASPPAVPSFASVNISGNLHWKLPLSGSTKMFIFIGRVRWRGAMTAGGSKEAG